MIKYKHCFVPFFVGNIRISLELFIISFLAGGTLNLYYYYGETWLGTLEKTEKGYVYTSNIPNEQRLLESNKALGGLERGMWNSIGKESPALFPAFKAVIHHFKRRDIVEKAKINSEDSEWDKLVKISKLNIHPGPYFYVQESPFL